MTFLDTGVLVGALLEQHPEHAACLEALQNSDGPFTDSHALAETFATLTGFYKVPVIVSYHTEHRGRPWPTSTCYGIALVLGGKLALLPAPFVGFFAEGSAQITEPDCEAALQFT